MVIRPSTYVAHTMCQVLGYMVHHHSRPVKQVVHHPRSIGARTGDQKGEVTAQVSAISKRQGEGTRAPAAWLQRPSFVL